MHKNATKCNKTKRKWCINKHGASKIIDTFETYQTPRGRYDEHSSKFFFSKKPRFNRPVGERNNFRRLLLADFGNGSRELVYGACLGRSFGASSNVKPAHNTTDTLQTYL
jgi:hypothetical protein